jgi:small subunit ribosomal protein S18
MGCRFCEDEMLELSLKDSDLLKQFMEDGNILPRRLTENCQHHQREVTLAIRRARVLGILGPSEAKA